MSRDLRSLLHESVDAVGRQHDATAAPVERDAALLWSRIARRRAWRAGGAALGVAAATATVAVGLTVLPHDPEPPAPPATTEAAPSPTPPPSREPRPTPTPSAEPTPTGPALLHEHPMLPPAVPLTAEALTATDDRWRMVVYREREGVADPVPTVAYLADPDGTLHEIPAAGPFGSLMGWLPGTPLVLQTTRDPSGTSTVEVLDLLTGEVVGTPPPDAWPHFVGDGTTDLVARGPGGGLVRFDVTGREVARTPARTDWHEVGLLASDPLSPDRSTAAVATTTGVVLHDARTLAPTATVAYPYPPEERSCSASLWLDDRTLVAQCQLYVVSPEGYLTASEHEWWLLGLDGSTRRVSAPDDRWGVLGASQGHLVMVQHAETADGTPVERWRTVAADGTTVDVAAPDVSMGVQDADGAGRFVGYTEVFEEGAHDGGIPGTVTVWDPRVGRPVYTLTAARPTIGIFMIPTLGN